MVCFFRSSCFSYSFFLCTAPYQAHYRRIPLSCISESTICSNCITLREKGIDAARVAALYRTILRSVISTQSRARGAKMRESRQDITQTSARLFAFVALRITYLQGKNSQLSTRRHLSHCITNGLSHHHLATQNCSIITALMSDIKLCNVFFIHYGEKGGNLPTHLLPKPVSDSI